MKQVQFSAEALGSNVKIIIQIFGVNQEVWVARQVNINSSANLKIEEILGKS